MHGILIILLLYFHICLISKHARCYIPVTTGVPNQNIYNIIATSSQLSHSIWTSVSFRGLRSLDSLLPVLGSSNINKEACHPLRDYTINIKFLAVAKEPSVTRPTALIIHAQFLFIKSSWIMTNLVSIKHFFSTSRWKTPCLRQQQLLWF